MNDKPSVMKTVIIEDEKAAVRNLTSLLNEVKPEAEIIAILDSINSTIEWFGIHPMPELVFMDIHLADGSAFEIFDHISITCPIIFTTAYDEYGLRAFKDWTTCRIPSPKTEADGKIRKRNCFTSFTR